MASVQALDIQRMTTDLCALRGDFLSWDQMDWIKNGDSLEILHIGKTSIKTILFSITIIIIFFYRLPPTPLK